MARILETTSPHAAGDFIGALPTDALRHQLLGDLVARWSQTDFSQALEWIDGIPGNIKEAALLHLSYRFQQYDPEGAVAYALTLASRNHQFLGMVTSQWAARDPRAVAAWVVQLPEGRDRDAAIASLTATWADRSGRDAAEFASSLPSGPAQNEAILTAVAGWARQEPRRALEWMQGLPAGTLQEQAYNQVLVAWGQHEPASAAEWLLALSDGPARDSRGPAKIVGNRGE